MPSLLMIRQRGLALSSVDETGSPRFPVINDVQGAPFLVLKRLSAKRDRMKQLSPNRSKVSFCFIIKARREY